MIIGESVLKVSHETMVAALQAYFETKTFAAGACPCVETITQEGYASEDGHKPFTVVLAPPADAAEVVR